MANKTKNEATRKPSWRDVLRVHPAAGLFPKRSEAGLEELGESIEERGVLVPILIWNYDEDNEELLDGASRLDAAERRGLLIIDENKNFYVKRPDGGRWEIERVWNDDPDPYAVAFGYNCHRRQMTLEQRAGLYIK